MTSQSKYKVSNYKKFNDPDLLAGEYQRGVFPEFHKTLRQAVDSVHTWHTKVIHSLSKIKI